MRRLLADRMYGSGLKLFLSESQGTCGRFLRLCIPVESYAPDLYRKIG